MRYYLLKNSTGDDIGNISGIQLQGRSSDYPYSSPTSYQFLPMLAPAKVTPNLDYFLVEKKAIMTDFISCVGIINASGFIISERSKLILERIKLMPLSFYPIRLLHKKTYYNYFWMHFEKDYLEDIDFNRSKFVLKKMPLWELPDWDYQAQEISPKSSIELKNIWKDNNVKQICVEELFLKETHNMQLNLFALSCINNGITLISEYLKQILEAEKINGIEIVQTSYPVHLT